jgi:hypothetical protein
MMSSRQTNLHILTKSRNLRDKAKTGVSLHCHTEHSKEMLDFVPHYANKLPIISHFWRREEVKYIEREGKEMDFSKSYWSPPLQAEDVYDLERRQINAVGLEAIASITDHDSIEANLRVGETAENDKVPISLEWTVPFEYGFFHVGVHNLPKENAAEITKTLLDYTFIEENQTNAILHQMFSMLNEMPEVLLILNHPIWDIELVGNEKHKILLSHFLEEHGQHIHALEINGFRSWSENKAVIDLANALDLPVVTGGDRHGCRPNTVINVTNSSSFGEFVKEIRVDKRSEIVLMPEYRQPLHSRQLQAFSEILRTYPDFPEDRREWFNRIFFDLSNDKGLVSLSDHGWVRGPLWVRIAIRTLGVLGSPLARPIFSLTRDRKDRVPKNFGKTRLLFPESEDTGKTLAPAANQPTSTGSAF